jgi:hypothetical protein
LRRSSGSRRRSRPSSSIRSKAHSVTCGSARAARLDGPGWPPAIRYTRPPSVFSEASSSPSGHRDPTSAPGASRRRDVDGHGIEVNVECRGPDRVTDEPHRSSACAGVP